MPTVHDVIQAMDTIAPPYLAMDGDPIGLHAGNRDASVTTVSISLDASLPALALAERMGADMMLVHHPRFYRGLSTLADDDPSGRRGSALVRSGKAVYSAHTNLDVAPGGTNDLLARAAGLTGTDIVEVIREEAVFKLAVFVPATHIDPVLKAVTGAGAGAIGNYSDCTFRSRGVGTFRPGEGTTPFLGSRGKLEEADEYRLETVFGEYSRDKVLAAMLQAHPYEEVAFDVYPVAGSANRFGFGRVGELETARPLGEFAAHMAKATGSTMTQFSGDRNAKARRVAVWAGAGTNFRALRRSGADTVVAGEVGYHEVEAFRDFGMSVVTLGHDFSEELVLKPLAARLRKLVPEVKFMVAGTGLYRMRNV